MKNMSRGSAISGNFLNRVKTQINDNDSENTKSTKILNSFSQKQLSKNGSIQSLQKQNISQREDIGGYKLTGRHITKKLNYDDPSLVEEPIANALDKINSVNDLQEEDDQA